MTESQALLNSILEQYYDCLAISDWDVEKQFVNIILQAMDEPPAKDADAWLVLMDERYGFT